MMSDQFSETRPAPRRRGLRGAVECAEAEDAIVAALCSSGMSVSPAGLAAAVQLAQDCADEATRDAYRELLRGRRTARYRLPSGAAQWLHRAAACVDAVPDDAMMNRLRAITDRVPVDAAARASFNAARYLLHRHPLTRAKMH